ncbi:hypothetical protein CERSUDRAFT_99205 [Gelatoporia subvermispora B]|uniref:F-box domain-containing protein n=1 Tax=Ceriporiopsis subvermispora (strain B) TaxID=914234 RepID=M2QL21_CERS8|nr:hypothetical protein CERSUDRAFT_99205 [Gelatoporia subvermispora B]
MKINASMTSDPPVYRLFATTKTQLGDGGDLYHSHVSEDALRRYPSVASLLSQFVHLRELQILWCEIGSLSMFKRFISGFPHLRHLEISDSSSEWTVPADPELDVADDSDTSALNLDTIVAGNLREEDFAELFVWLLSTPTAASLRAVRLWDLHHVTSGYRAALRNILQASGGNLKTLAVSVRSFDDASCQLSLATRLRSLTLLDCYKQPTQLSIALDQLRSPDLDTLTLDIGPIIQHDSEWLEQMCKDIEVVLSRSHFAKLRRLVICHTEEGNDRLRPMSIEELERRLPNWLPKLHARNIVEVSMWFTTNVFD